ncbi:MAG: GNAT family N-acetyltransferase [Candidatus Micrarchaeaceae archaeon]
MIEIRDIKHGDVKSLIELIKSIYKESDYFTWFDHEPEGEELNYMFSRKIAMILEGNAVAIVAVDDGTAIGECEIIKDGDEGKIGIVVSSSHRRMHIGSDLLERGEKEAATIGIGAIVAEVDKRNSAALDFFEKRGFEENSNDTILKEGHEIVVLKKRISGK